MTRTLYAGHDRLRVASGWDLFLWHGRRYRIMGAVVEVWDRARVAWLPSIRLTTSAPKGRGAA